jgi:hypothetical protein
MLFTTKARKHEVVKPYSSCLCVLVVSSFRAGIRVRPCYFGRYGAIFNYWINSGDAGVLSPTIVYQNGWHIIIYPNERNEPMHVHAEKGEAECKYWVRANDFELEEAWAYRMTPALRREVRQIIFENFEEIIEAWRRLHNR